MLRADSHYCTPEVLRFCRARQLDYTLGVAPTTTLRKHIITLEQSTAVRKAAKAGLIKLAVRVDVLKRQIRLHLR
jgi:hypothetical protein